VTALLRAGVLVLFAAVVQVASIGGATIVGATPDLLLVIVVLAAWHLGSIPGSIAGFLGGLVVDLVTLDHVGVTSLLLTLAGYWAGRYGETTGRARPAGAYLAVSVLTVAVALAAFALHALLGESVDAGRALMPVFAGIVVNTALAFALHRPLRRVVGATLRIAPAPEGEPVG
jgi:rod shape-determining protein MreD